MKTMRISVGFFPLLLSAFVLQNCIAQKPLGLTFTEAGKGAGIQSGQVDKTATSATTTLSSINNAIGTAIVLLEFTVKENGSKDGYPLQIKELRFTNVGTADVADFRFVLEGPGSNNTISSTSGQTVTFKEFGDIIVADGDTTGKTYQVKVHVRNNIQGSTEDNSTIILNTSPVTDFEVTETSSNFLQSVATFQQNPATAIDVIATELQGKGNYSFGTVAVNYLFPGSRSMYATDANGRVDKNYTTNVTLQSRQNDCAAGETGLGNPGVGANLTVAAVQGVALFTDLQFTVASKTFKVYATSGVLTAQCTALIIIP